jgi:hypothetical protein
VSPKYVRCTYYEATVEPVEREFDEPFWMDFQFRTEDDDALFRIVTRIHDDELSVFQTHIARFDRVALHSDATEEEVTAFLEKNVLPAVFPYVQEGASAAASRVRPSKPLYVNWDAQKPLDLTTD